MAKRKKKKRVFLFNRLLCRMGTLMCKDSNEDEWIYVIRTGSCRVIKALTQVTPKLRTKKKPQVIYDNFGTKRQSQYSIQALGTFERVIIDKFNSILKYLLIF